MTKVYPAHADRRCSVRPTPAGNAPRVSSACMNCGLHRLLACTETNADLLLECQTAVDRLTIRRGEALFHADMPAARVYFIRSGFIKLVKYSGNGGQRIVRIIKGGGVAGMEMLFSPTFENAAIAMGEVMACAIPAAGFRRMIDDHPVLQRQLLQHAHLALRDAETWLSELAGGNARTRERLARLLLCLRDGDSDRIYRFSLEDIGAILGTSLETVCRELTQFKRGGLLIKDSVGCADNTMPFYYADITRLEAVATGVATPPRQRKARVA